MRKRLEQERAQARSAPLAAALAEAQQVMCTASIDYIPYAHTHSHIFGVDKRMTFEVFFRVPLRVSTS